jgi:hypothetical protein
MIKVTLCRTSVHDPRLNACGTRSKDPISFLVGTKGGGYSPLLVFYAVFGCCTGQGYSALCVPDFCADFFRSTAIVASQFLLEGRRCGVLE